MGRNYFQLCNDILQEMYYEQALTFADLEDTMEGRRVKNKLNQILTQLVMNEKDIWTFREKTKSIYLIGDQQEYDLPNGFIEHIVPVAYPAPLIYTPDWKYLPMNSHGRPIRYWIWNNKIVMFPIPNASNEGLEMKMRYLTNDCAVDDNGCLKEKLELETDEPIIPNQYRDILIYGVCKDLRASSNDAKSDFFAKRYKELYKQMLSSCNRSDDYPNGLDMMGREPSILRSYLDVFYNPRSGGGR